MDDRLKLDLYVKPVNTTMELSEVSNKWAHNLEYDCYCLEDVAYTSVLTVPKFQKLSIFAPKEYIDPDGNVCLDGKKGKYTAKNAPVVFQNEAAGYRQMPPLYPGGIRFEAVLEFIKRGMVFVSCGCRGWDTRDTNGETAGKSPYTLIDLKTAIRFLRHNSRYCPGDLSRIITVGTSAGGAMSTLLGTTGDNGNYLPYLKENNAFMEESDAVFGSQIYCPIIDLEHSNGAYEWQFHNIRENEESFAGKAGVMSDYDSALSDILREDYIRYFNSLGLKNPKTGEKLILNSDYRSGSGYAYLMDCLNESAGKFLRKLSMGEAYTNYSVDDYLSGNYTFKVNAPPPQPLPGETPLSLGDLAAKPVALSKPIALPQIEVLGKAKPWLMFDGVAAKIASLDDYFEQHRRRMKPCATFDNLKYISGENQEMGATSQSCKHYDDSLWEAVQRLKERFPSEYEKYSPDFKDIDDPETKRRVYLLNPLHYIGTNEQSKFAEHFRIRVGSKDADTAFTISMSLAVKLANAGYDANYELVWDRPHENADYPGEIQDWIESIV